jgi:hypothetical protein
MTYCYSEHSYRHGRERIDAHVALLAFRPLILYGEYPYVTCRVLQLSSKYYYNTVHTYTVYIQGWGPYGSGARAAAPLDPPSPRPPSCCAVLGCVRACMYGACATTMHARPAAYAAAVPGRAVVRG